MKYRTFFGLMLLVLAVLPSLSAMAQDEMPQCELPGDVLVALSNLSTPDKEVVTNYLEDEGLIESADNCLEVLTPAGDFVVTITHAVAGSAHHPGSCPVATDAVMIAVRPNTYDMVVKNNARISYFRFVKQLETGEYVPMSDVQFSGLGEENLDAYVMTGCLNRIDRLDRALFTIELASGRLYPPNQDYDHQPSPVVDLRFAQ